MRIMIKSFAGVLLSTDLIALRKILTAHARADRFSEGYLTNGLESGHLIDGFRSLAEFRDEMTTDK